MTRDQYIDSRLHHYLGVILDVATTRRTGAELSVFLGTMRQRIMDELGRTWDLAQPPNIKPTKPAPLNGPAQPVRK